MSRPLTAGRVAEVFFSIQGEGPTARVPAVFVRLQGCSVGCARCDTRYSWNHDAGREIDLDALMSENPAHPRRDVFVAGGEPLESALFSPLITALQQRVFEIEVETSGTIAPLPGLGEGTQWNVSARPAGSQVEEAPINPAAIQTLLERNVWWKFVVAAEEDVAEVLRLVERFALPRERIPLQREAVRREEKIERAPWGIEACKRRGFRFSHRLHILTWGARRGV